MIETLHTSVYYFVYPPHSYFSISLASFRAWMDPTSKKEGHCDITAQTVLLDVLFCLTYMYCTGLFPMLRFHLQHLFAHLFTLIYLSIHFSLVFTPHFIVTTVSYYHSLSYQCVQYLVLSKLKSKNRRTYVRTHSFYWAVFLLRPVHFQQRKERSLSVCPG